MASQTQEMIPFVEKYRPKKLEDFVGNKEAVIKLENWLRSWKSQRKKVALLVGPAGVGKTSVALYLAQKYNFEFVEVNASDKRNKKAVEHLVGRSSTEGTVIQGAKVRKLILVDEADGLFGQEDRGGGAALKRAIIATRTPILATANDADAKSLKSAKTYMLVVKFERLSEEEIFELIKRVTIRENLQIDNETLALIAKNSSGDARSALNDLESIAYYGSYKDVVFSSRNQEQSMKSALVKIFNAKDIQSARNATEGADVDYRELLQYINEHSYKQAKTAQELSDMYELIAEADFYLSQCYITQNWTFLKYFFTLVSSVGIVKDSPFKYSEFSFPTFWAKMGRLRMKHAKLNSIIEKSRSKLHCSSNQFKSVFYPYLRIIFNTDPAMAAGIAVWLKLEKEEIEFLADKSKKMVKEIEKHSELAYLQMVDDWIETPEKTSSSTLLDFGTRIKRKKQEEKDKKEKQEDEKNTEVSTIEQEEKEEIKEDKSQKKPTKTKKKIEKDKKVKQGQPSLDQFFGNAR
ncbi:MAG: replication factor C large subunit [Candidatus Heimdallarchaeaceae archaeon]